MIRYLTAGESHGKGLVIILDGVPANLKISDSDFKAVLSERQKGFGRGGRQKIEADSAEILSGIRHGITTGAPVALLVKNRDFENWKLIMDTSPMAGIEQLNVPRPGHADLTGGIKYNHRDFRNVLERASARETAARVLAGAVSKKLLAEFGIDVEGFVSSIGGIKTAAAEGKSLVAIRKMTAACEKTTGAGLRYPDAKKAAAIIRKIKAAAKKGDTLGGIIKVVTSRLPVGLGDYTQWDKKLDAAIARGVMSIQAIKGVEIGAGFEYADNPGSAMHDRIYYAAGAGYYRGTNNSGGIEGGMTNGEPLVVTAAMKPISTVRMGLDSVNVLTRKKTKTIYERSDVCAVPAASLVAECVVAVEIANAFLEKFGTDDVALIKSNYKNYLAYLKKY
jgi:chorismate synthase